MQFTDVENIVNTSLDKTNAQLASFESLLFSHVSDTPKLECLLEPYLSLKQEFRSTNESVKNGVGCLKNFITENITF